MRKKILVWLAVVIMLMTLIPGAAFAEDQEKYSGKLTYNNMDLGDFSFDFRKITEDDNTKYSDETAILASLLSIDANKGMSMPGMDQANQNISLNGGTGYLLEQLGFDVVVKDLSEDKYTQDGYDITKFCLGRRVTKVDGKDYVVYAVAAQGTNGVQWISNFDVGADTEDYYKETESRHDEWVNKNEHKGFSVAAERVKDYVDACMLKFADQDAGMERTILITGHSRGAAVSNILGKMYEEEGKVKPYTYTFATPGTTTAGNAGDYKTIYNIINEDDFVPQLPLKKWGFVHYGTDYRFSIADNGWKPIFKNLTGKDYTASNDPKKKADNDNNFGGVAANREELYQIGDKKYEFAKKVFKDSGYEFQNYADVKKGVTKDRAKVCPAFVIRCLSDTVTNLTNADLSKIKEGGLEGINELLKSVNKPQTFALATFLLEDKNDKYHLGVKYFMSMIPDLSSGHNPVGYYIIAREADISNDNAAASVISSGYIWIVVGTAVLAVIAVAVTAIRRKKGNTIG